MLFRSDELSVDDARELKPDGVLLSPGPGRPEDAGILCDAISGFAGDVPVFGVCLGHQAIGHVFGGRVIRAPHLVHGKTSNVTHDGTGVFENIPSPLTATRYHSLVVERESMPESLRITASTEDGLVMGLRHREFDIEGVQFHPESVLTEHGHGLVANFLRRAGLATSR